MSNTLKTNKIADTSSIDIAKLKADYTAAIVKNDYSFPETLYSYYDFCEFINSEGAKKRIYK